MVRKLALAVSLALGTLSVPVHALGLGELSSKSTLNQNFQGDIALLSVSPEELDPYASSWRTRRRSSGPGSSGRSTCRCSSSSRHSRNTANRSFG